MTPPSEQEIKAEIEKITKIYESYRFVYSNADTDSLKKEIQKVAQAHILGKIDALTRSAESPLKQKISELRSKLTNLNY